METEQTLEKELGWRAFRIEGVLDFSLVGILAKLTGILAERKIPVFAVSTYNTDYLLIKKEKMPFVLQALRENEYETEE